MYLRTDEELETVNALKMAAQFASKIHEDVHLWRWTIIALHNAAQGAMVLSLRHGNGLLALSDKCATAWMQAYEKDEAYPPEKLDSYLGLYKKIRHSKTGQIAGNKQFVPNTLEEADIKELHALRNAFIHFTPKGWSLQVDGLPRICLATTRLIRFLASETRNIFWHALEAREECERHINALEQALESMHEVYAESAA